MTNTWLIVEAGVSTEVSLALCESLGCNGFYSGVPPFLRETCEKEGWTLPHLWEEIVEDQPSVDIDIPGWPIVQYCTASNGQTFFPVTGLNTQYGRHAVYKNGLLMLVGDQNDYTISAQGVTFLYGLSAADAIVIFG